MKLDKKLINGKLLCKLIRHSKGSIQIANIKCLTFIKNGSKLWGLKWSQKTERHYTTKPQTTTGFIMGKHEYSKVCYCKNTQVCKQIWIKMKWIIESLQLFHCRAPPVNEQSVWWQGHGSLSQARLHTHTHTHTRRNPARRRSQTLESSFTLLSHHPRDSSASKEQLQQQTSMPPVAWNNFRVATTECYSCKVCFFWWGERQME